MNAYFSGRGRPGSGEGRDVARRYGLSVHKLLDSNLASYIALLTESWACCPGQRVPVIESFLCPLSVTSEEDASSIALSFEPTSTSTDFVFVLVVFGPLPATVSSFLLSTAVVTSERPSATTIDGQLEKGTC